MQQDLKVATPDKHAAGTDEVDLIAVVGELVRELHPQRSRMIEVEPSSRIERDLGIDSLGRTELILRIERAFRVRLPAETIGEAETVADLIVALRAAGPRRVERSRAAPTQEILPSVQAAREARTLVDMLDWHARNHPDRLHLTVLQDETTTLGAFTYGGLAEQARAVAHGLISRDVALGDRIAIMLPTSTEFFVAFFGILYAGAIPVPIYPPMRLSQLEDHLRRQTRILQNADARMLITMPEGLRLAGLLSAQTDELISVETVSALSLSDATVTLPRIDDPTAIALIQYTSGSTGDPKGVALSHANLLANIRAMGTAMRASSADVFVSWLPLYHDMGLIGAWLGCLYFGAPLYAMSPLSFLVRPESWLWAIHRFRATFSASPNFGFELCLNKIDDAQMKGLDLSSLRMVANGAEPVSPHTVRRFTEKFGRYGFPPQAMAPVYGLAECAVGLAFPPPGRLPVIDRVDRAHLSATGHARPASADDQTPLELPACGHPLPGHEIRIVDDRGRELGERRQGRIEFRGPSAIRGYFHNEAKTRELLHGDWLDTADRGYIAGGDIFITGRIKDIIIRAGRHLYPHEIEEATAEIRGVRKGGVAVFGVSDPVSGTERVVILAETRETDPKARAALQARAHELMTDIAGTPPDEVVLVPPRTVPKTSSGKIRRSAARDLYVRGGIGEKQPAVWSQILRLALSGAGAKGRRAIRRAGETLYAIWWWAILCAGFVFGIAAVVILPKRKLRWRVLRAIGRTALRLMGIPVAISGIERLPQQGAIVIFNHSSYTDVLILTAVLPGEPAVVAKKELSGQLLIGQVLRRLGIPYVDRYEAAASLADTQVLIDIARQGRTLVVFPEGTFTRRAGLTGFYLGAFKIAAEAELPVIPGIIRGTRSILRSDQWFPRRASVEVEIAEPIMPTGKEFSAVVKLRDAARAVILAKCGEPDIGELAKPDR